MNEIYIKILAERAEQDRTLLAKLPEEVRTEVEKYIEDVKQTDTDNEQIL